MRTDSHVDPNNHTYKSGHNPGEMSHLRNDIRRTKRTLSPQYSTMDDDTGASELRVTSTHSKAVNTKSMSETDFRKVPSVTDREQRLFEDF